ncbi:SNF2 family N-terminal domain-containing protein [Triangularia verruculosa]|uniref:SNF2 family N-terminal domain-containing protein n=1 Tax=Triangularia verruculosa TaxID=2587418 RepID=A0AAN7ARY9_9PEZI|nr:SNF2 family N-terminal domain-containing protein [Triangularia verruculosa]
MSSGKRPYPFGNEDERITHDPAQCGLGDLWNCHEVLNQDHMMEHSVQDFASAGPFETNPKLQTNLQRSLTPLEERQTNTARYDLNSVGVDSTQNSGDEAYFCFGSIPDLKAQVREEPPTRQDAMSAPYQCFDILEQGALFYGLDSGGLKFAILNKKVCQDLRVLLSGAELRLKAFISRKEWLRMVKHREREKMPTVVNFDLNIYGLRKCAVYVGRALSKVELFLQQPLFGADDSVYYNPQYLHPEEILGNEVSSTPMSILKRQPYGTQHPVVNEEPKKVAQGEVHHTGNDAAEINTILGSLSFRKHLVKSMADRSIIKTTILDHQAEALDFILRRETGDLPMEMTLWEQREDLDSDLDQGLYRHIITGARSKQPRDVRGGIIADDMGLGKTLVVLSTIAGSTDRAKSFSAQGQSHLQKGPVAVVTSRATLVICPSTLLVDSWIDEIRKHTYPGYVTFHKHHGQGRQDDRSQRQLLESDVVLTTYATVAAELRQGQSILRCIDWFRIVLDEAHEIRNPSTKQHQAVTELRSEHRWCLTGTPIQNSVDDLGALVIFLKVPILENPASFRKFITNPSAPNSRERFKNLRVLLGSICLRRSKEILGLPDPKPEMRFIELTASERHEYRSIEQHCRLDIDRIVSGHGRARLNSTVLRSLLRLRLFCNNGTPRREFATVSPGNEMDMDEVLSYLQQNNEADCSYCFRQVYSISDAPDTDGGLLVPECLHLVCRGCMPQYHAEGSLCPLHGVAGQVQHSLSFGRLPLSGTIPQAQTQYPSKLRAVLNDISMQLSQKSIVFSSWKKTLSLIGEMLTNDDIPFYCIHGSLSLGERIRILQDFRSPTGVNVLLMTLGTGAVGLNLAVASRIYLMEPQWNPSVELQAIGRALRLGQKEQVAIVRYIVKETIEDSNVLSRQEAKLQLASGGFGKRKRGIPTERFQTLLGFFGVEQSQQQA